MVCFYNFVFTLVKEDIRTFLKFFYVFLVTVYRNDILTHHVVTHCKEYRKRHKVIYRLSYIYQLPIFYLLQDEEKKGKKVSSNILLETLFFQRSFCGKVLCLCGYCLNFCLAVKIFSRN